MSYRFSRVPRERNAALDRSTAGRVGATFTTKAFADNTLLPNSGVAEVGRSRFFAGVPGRPGRTAPAVRPLPFHTPGSQRNPSYDDGMDRSVRTRVGNYMVDMRVGSQVGEPITATVVAVTGAIAAVKSLNIKSVSINNIKNWYNSTFQKQKQNLQRHAADNKSFFESATTGIDDFINKTWDIIRTNPTVFTSMANPTGDQAVNQVGNYPTMTGTAQMKDFAIWFANMRQQWVSFKNEYARNGGTYGGAGVNDAAFNRVMLIGGEDWPQNRAYWNSINEVAAKLESLTLARKNELIAMVNENTVHIVLPSSLPTLKNGSRGDDVKSLQTFLKVFGFGDLTIDGQFGAATTSAVKNFQSFAKLAADGIVGSNTWGKIKQMLGGATDVNLLATTDANGNVSVKVILPDLTMIDTAGGNPTVIPGGGQGGGGSGGGGGGSATSTSSEGVNPKVLVGSIIGLAAIGIGGAYLYSKRSKK